jgi:hypothetical protein
MNGELKDSTESLKHSTGSPDQGKMVGKNFGLRFPDAGLFEVFQRAFVLFEFLAGFGEFSL